MKILVVRLKAIGDSILSLPVCGTLRRAYPNAVIHYLVYEYIEPLLRDHPYIDQTLFISNEERKNSFLYIKKALEFRRNKYDLVIDIIATPTSALLTFFTGASRKIGFSRPKSRAIFYNKKVQRLVPGANAIDRKLTLLSDLVDNKQFIRNYSIPLPDSEVAPMDFQMKKTGEVFSMFNLELDSVRTKKDDLDQAFATGVRLAMAASKK